MSSSNWEESCRKSGFHFEWLRQEMPGYDCRWVCRFEGDWESELGTVVSKAEPVTWRSRGKRYHADDPQIEAEENDLVRSGMDPNTVIMRKAFDFDGIWKKMIDQLGLVNTKQAFHIQFPGEMLNLHIDKQYEMNDDFSKVARFFIFLDDWKPGHFLQMGTSFLKWRKGDVVWFDWPDIPHASANAGWEPRCLIQVTGTRTQVTENILLGQAKYLKI